METYIDKVTDLIAEKTNLKNRNLIKLYSLLVLTKGENVTLKDVHDAWAMDMNFRDFNPPRCYGHKHTSIVPFEELSKETQDKDMKYVQAIKEVARILKNKGD
jgi:hypothetical protein